MKRLHEFQAHSICCPDGTPVLRVHTRSVAVETLNMAGQLRREVLAVRRAKWADRDDLREASKSAQHTRWLIEHSAAMRGSPRCPVLP